MINKRNSSNYYHKTRIELHIILAIYLIKQLKNNKPN